MLKTFLKMLTVMSAAALVISPAFAQSACGERAPFVQQLEKVHHETPQAMGLSSDGGVFEVFASPAGTWTILVTYPNGVTCVVAAGEAWERLPLRALGLAA